MPPNLHSSRSNSITCFTPAKPAALAGPGRLTAGGLRDRAARLESVGGPGAGEAPGRRDHAGPNPPDPRRGVRRDEKRPIIASILQASGSVGAVADRLAWPPSGGVH